MGDHARGQSLAFDLQKGPNKLQVMGFFARCQFLPSHHLQSFEEMFLTNFFTKHLAIFNPFNTNPTFRYIACKDAEEGNPVHDLIKKAKNVERAERLRMASVTAYSRHQQKQKDTWAPFLMSEDGHGLGGGECLGPERCGHRWRRTGPQIFGLSDPRVPHVNTMYYVVM